MKELACLYAVSRDMLEELSLDELCRTATSTSFQPYSSRSLPWR